MSRVVVSLAALCFSFSIPTTVKAQNAAPPSSSGDAMSRPGYVATIPFHLEGNHILVSARVGKDDATAAQAPPLNFVLDTGADTSAIDGGTVKRFQLDLGPSGTVLKNFPILGAADANNRATVEIKTHLTVIAEKVSLADITLWVMPLPQIAAYGIQGLLGADVFRAGVVEVDYAASQIRLYRANQFVPPDAKEGFDVLPLQFTQPNGRAFIEVPVTPLGLSPTTARLEVDTGMEDAVTFNSPFVKRAKWDVLQARTIPQRTAGVGAGFASERVGRLRSLQLGRTTLTLPLVSFSFNQKGMFATSETDGLIGGALFRRFDVIFDFPHKRLFVRPNPDATVAFPFCYYGFTPSPGRNAEGGYTVQDVDKDSPAWRGGLREGDAILAVDGKLLASMDRNALKEFLFDGRKEPRRFGIKPKAGGPIRELTITPDTL